MVYIILQKKKEFVAGPNQIKTTLSHDNNVWLTGCYMSLRATFICRKSIQRLSV